MQCFIEGVQIIPIYVITISMRSVESNFNSDSGWVGSSLCGVRHMWMMSMMNDVNKKSFKQGNLRQICMHLQAMMGG